MGDSILFVDDEENVLKSLKRLFLDESFEIYTTISGAEGLKILKEKEISVIVSDQRMPSMSGTQFLERARLISPYSTRMILTGYADAEAAMEAINRGGAWRYITKPWNDQELLVAVKNAAELYRITKENIYLTELTKKQNEELQKWSSELEMYVQQQTIDLTRQNQELIALNNKLDSNLQSFVSSFANLMEIRNRSVCGHSASVAVLSSEMAVRMGLAQEEASTIAIAAQLHDIGKIGIPDVSLLKDPELLTAEERVQYEQHPLLGQSVVNTIENLVGAGVLIRHHHEAFDGNGFPDRLKGDEIPQGARIICITDAFDRLCIIGNGGLPTAKALETIKSFLGKSFDPRLFSILQVIAREKTETFVRMEGEVEVELAPKELHPGMIVSKDIRTGTGLVLMKKGVVLTQKHIEMIDRCCYLDPARTGIFVMLDRSKLTSFVS